MIDPAHKKQVLLQLLYSEVFQHPLTVEEIAASFERAKVNYKDIVANMVKSGLIIEEQGYFYLFEDTQKVLTRQLGMHQANLFREKSHKVARFIYTFPFVKAVGISGSLSKGILHKDGDFDFFIITQRNRLWIARTLLILYKKLFLFNSKKYFCVNYFIDDENLEIHEKNRFTATEIHSLIPVIGDVFSNFHQTNHWITDYYPGAIFSSTHLEEFRKPLFSRMISGMLKGRFGEWCDLVCMRITFKRWKKKFHHFQDEKFELALKTRRYVSKHHPNDFQTKVLTKHQELIQRYTSMKNDLLVEEGITL